MRVRVNGGLEGAVKEKNSTSKRRAFSQKMEVGNSYRLFFPLADDEKGDTTIIVASAWGRKLDSDILGKGCNFVKLSPDFNKDGNLHDNSGIAPYARIARVIFEAECAFEKDEAKDEAARTARALGKDIDTIALASKLKEIEQTYHGDPDAKPQRIYATKSPVIGRQTLEIATECLVVPLNVSGAPEWEKAEVCAFPFTSDKKIAQLRTIYQNSDYCAPDAEYLEVGWTYSGKDKKEAGSNAALTGISKDTSIATKFPELWEANKYRLEDISSDPDTMASKNWTLSAATPVKEVVERLKAYLLKKPILLPHIDLEADITKQAAKDILELGVADGVKSVQESLLALVNQTEDAEEEAEPEVTADVVQKTMNITNVEDVHNTGVSIDSIVDTTDIDNL